MRGIVYILTIFRAHHACRSIYFHFVPEEYCLKILIDSIFVKKQNKQTKNKKTHNAKYYFSFCFLKVNILHTTFFSFHLALLPTPGWDSGVLRLVLSDQ